MLQCRMQDESNPTAKHNLDARTLRQRLGPHDRLADDNRQCVGNARKRIEGAKLAPSKSLDALLQAVCAGLSLLEVTPQLHQTRERLDNRATALDTDAVGFFQEVKR